MAKETLEQLSRQELMQLIEELECVKQRAEQRLAELICNEISQLGDMAAGRPQGLDLFSPKASPLSA